MKKIKIDPSIAVDLDIDRVVQHERVAVNFTADRDWTGTFELRIYNSIAKNTVVQPANALSIVGKRMVWTIEPAAQGLTERIHFYEIVETQSKRIYFRGQLNITKL